MRDDRPDDDITHYPAAVQERWDACNTRVWEEGRRLGRAISYGACPRAGDPRDYYPDLECCTRAEVLRWAEACDLWDRGDRHPEGPCPASDVCSRDESFGIGVYFFDAPPGWFDDDDPDDVPEVPHAATT